MTLTQIKKLETAHEVLSDLTAEILAQTPCNLYASFTDSDGGRSMCLSANVEALTYFAFIFLRLAKEQECGSHMHFDADTVLDECDRDLIVRCVQSPSLT
jgi:hypothetical protein